jgi:hypothetical protein
MCQWPQRDARGSTVPLTRPFSSKVEEEGQSPVASTAKMTASNTDADRLAGALARTYSRDRAATAASRICAWRGSIESERFQ